MKKNPAVQAALFAQDVEGENMAKSVKKTGKAKAKAKNKGKGKKTRTEECFTFAEEKVCRVCHCTKKKCKCDLHDSGFNLG
jgi:hypothetical protein